MEKQLGPERYQFINIAIIYEDALEFLSEIVYNS
jgi:hypothetical protein